MPECRGEFGKRLRKLVEILSVKIHNHITVISGHCTAMKVCRYATYDDELDIFLREFSKNSEKISVHF